jgi:hypothetical protein
MNEKRIDVWRWPIFLNAAIVCGLAVALLCDAQPMQWIAWALVAWPLITVAYAGCRR